jgi:hypothetical protein
VLLDIGPKVRCFPASGTRNFVSTRSAHPCSSRSEVSRKLGLGYRAGLSRRVPRYDDGWCLAQNPASFPNAGNFVLVEALDGKCSVAVVIQTSGKMDTLKRNDRQQGTLGTTGMESSHCT